MKIAITIIVNILIALVVFTGFMKGKRYGLKYELPKLLILLGVLAGMFFLTPIINEKVAQIGIIQELITRYVGLDKLIYTLILVLPVVLIYTIVSFILRVLKKISDKNTLKGMNRAKKGRVRSIDKAERRRIKKQEKKDFKYNRKTIKLNTCSKIGGIICGVFIAILLCFCISLPMKYITKSISSVQENLSTIETIHDNSVLGLLDNKVISFDNCIINK